MFLPNLSIEGQNQRWNSLWCLLLRNIKHSVNKNRRKRNHTSQGDGNSRSLRGSIFPNKLFTYLKELKWCIFYNLTRRFFSRRPAIRFPTGPCINVQVEQVWICPRVDWGWGRGGGVPFDLLLTNDIIYSNHMGTSPVIRHTHTTDNITLPTLNW